jgi:hypothetical protein
MLIPSHARELKYVDALDVACMGRWASYTRIGDVLVKITPRCVHQYFASADHVRTYTFCLLLVLHEKCDRWILILINSTIE